MSHRTSASREQVPLPARARTDLYENVSTEMGDRRAISIVAMFAFDEPADCTPRPVTGDEGIVAFLPDCCR